LNNIKVIQNCTIRKLGCGFLFAFHSNFGSILHHLRYKARYWSEIVIIFIPPLHSALPLGGFVPSKYCRPVWYGKTRMMGRAAVGMGIPMGMGVGWVWGL